MAEKGYVWRFKPVGGTGRVDISTGEDIRHLGELDKKLWTVLSCPACGLEFDQKTLEILDTDKDGKIKTDEIVAAAKYLTSVIKNADLLLEGSDSIKLDQFNTDNPEGKKLHDSAKQILSDRGMDKDSISLEDASDTVAIFSGTKFNGDGVITPVSTDDPSLKLAIENAVSTTGGTVDRSGVQGVTAEQLEAFYAACADYSAWVSAGKSSDVLPYGDDTEAALEAVNAVKEKVADYFMRCRLSAFDGDSIPVLDVQVDKIGAISSGNLAECGEQIASFPLARVTGAQVLPLDAINPAWKDAFTKLSSLVLSKDFPDAKSISEEQWNSVVSKLGAYTAWKAAKKGESVESLGTERVEEILKKDEKAALLDLVAQDKALEEESNSIDNVARFLRLYKNFYHLLRNYVTFDDFYGKGTKAIFQAGRLFIDQRSLDLCIKVEDMAAHGDMAGLSGMYILYCACSSKSSGKSMNIAAVLTNGDVNNLRVGMNAVFYDNDGTVYDAVVTRIVENPVSIRQAFWSPYNKLARSINDRIDKSAAEKESKSTGDLLAKANGISLTPPKEGEAADKTAAPKKFDIAVFAGIFAAIGMAVSYLTQALVSLSKGIASKWYILPILIALILLCISGPSMFIAWRKLRKRNLAPLLNANGWAINAHVLVNIGFGAGLTSLAKFPSLASVDPKFARLQKRRRFFSWFIAIVVIGLCCVGGYYLGKYRKEKKAAAPAPAATTIVIPAADTSRTPVL